ncbi:HNH endonuclease [Martelella alba]|uniref:HNH endonuclease n=2 Tax=Martelella alba TaxID=2590451 RepID=A0A506U747_9HYPH|nr:HNH endonuclease signature motif containing protein [Martelella alba]TPW28921.1 HNH endonuclease [Martelella alba]
MPKKGPRVCGYCGQTHFSGEQCRYVAAMNRDRKARFDAKRPSASKRGYNAEWQRESKAYLSEHPQCRRCGAPAVVVDHIRPHRGNDDLFWDRANWQPLCRHCHNSAKQAEERAKHKGSFAR